MATLYIVRHGNTFDEGETVRRVGARTDLPLSSSGETQAAALGAYFKSRSIAFDRAYCSPLQRTRQTADIIMARTESVATVACEAFLTEIDYGPDENQPEDIVTKRLGESALRRWDEEAVPPEGWRVDPADLRARWRAFFDQFSDPAGEQYILAGTSHGVARFALDAAKPAGAFPRKLRTGAFGCVRINDAEPLIEHWDVRPA
jgi:probable phosphoglycerate mutase